MKRKMIYLLTPIFSLSLFILLPVLGINQVVSEEKIEENYLKLFSPDFDERYKAVSFFYHLDKEKVPKKVLDKIVDLYEKERSIELKIVEIDAKTHGEVIKKIPPEWRWLVEDKYEEAVGLYIQMQYKIVARSCDPDYLEFVMSYAGNAKDIACYGDQGVELLIKQKSQKNPFIFTWIAKELFEGEAGYIPQGEVRNKLKQALMEVVTREIKIEEKDEKMRRFKLIDMIENKVRAVEALGASGDEDVIPFLEKVAATDTQTQEIYVYSEDKNAPPKKKTVYPVKEAAIKALEKLKRFKET